MSFFGVPRLPPGLIPRPRVQAALDSAAPLTVLHAPAGYGKTVALAQWATATDEDGVWLRLREDSAEPKGFVSQLAHALDDFGLLDERNPLVQADASLQVAEPWSLLERGLRRIGTPLAIVIDQSEYLSDTTIRGILRLLADLPQLSVKTSTRTSNAFTESGVALSIAVTRIGPADLELTVSEAAALVGDTEHSERVREVLDFGATPALARVVALDADPHAVTSTSAIEERIESLLRLRGSAADARFAAFIQRVALTDAIDAEFAAELTGEADAAELLDRAEREGLGIWNATSPHAPSRRSFELSPVFRRIIERYSRRELPADTVRKLELRVARWHLAGRRPFPAMRIAVAWKEWGLATDIVRESWNEIITGGGGLSTLFADVPLMTLRNLPLVTIVLAISANAQGTQRLRALEYFALAAYGARMHRTKSGPADRVVLLTIETAAYRVSGRGTPALAAAVAGLDLMRTMGPAEHDLLGRNEPTLYNHLGTTLLYAGRAADALECFRASTAVSDAKGLRAGLQGLALQAGTLAIRGDMPEAAQVLADADRRVWPDSWADGYPGSFAVAARAYAALEAGDPDAAAAHLAVLEPHRATIEHWSVLAHLDALISLLNGSPETAQVRLDTVVREQKARHALHSDMAADLRHTSALIRLASGEVAAAEEALAKGPDTPRRRVGRARIALARGDLERAMQLLAGWGDNEGDDAVSSRVRGEQLALVAGAIALAEATSPRPERAEHVHVALRRLAAFVRDRGLSLPVMLTPVAAIDAMLSAAMLRAGTADAYDEDFVALLTRARDAGVIGSRGVRPRLTERELAVAATLAHHSSVDDIAAAMSVSRNTVKSQLRALYRKLEVGSRDEALYVLAAWELSPSAQDLR
ncbi:LuxR C-terminal-related transcriptional regulator [Microbacterium sp. HD4P20]|uniref:LuxR C-terminal-related transcriptional regulator n=1 Tax=Microbacterium sp. HD4P20 TaxID=2864874 RepID=UPI001C6400D4|nr:LuxR C-terminal-related transcriptional regulator [Microbacterium sp. HD4P20]MCP2638126.1 LuxR C-terminal-related transcriptional regulator [Microbacterium sp. HD4P20]